MSSTKIEVASERIFRIPALILIMENIEISTTNIISILRGVFNPEGQDTKIGKNRKDDYFSQKIRNINSHKSFIEYVECNKNIWKLTKKGYEFIEQNIELIDGIKSIMCDSSFTYYEKIAFIDIAILPYFPRRKTPTSTTRKVLAEKVLTYDEIINEGQEIEKTIKIRERSNRLRNLAIKHFTKEGLIQCEICGFDFGEIYGSFGEGFIEIHHKKPIFKYESEDEEVFLKKALNNLAPVCSNCHKMLHHKRNVFYEDIVNFVKKYQKIKNK